MKPGMGSAAANDEKPIKAHTFSNQQVDKTNRRWREEWEFQESAETGLRLDSHQALKAFTM
jgi:hypothetical protein